MPQHSGVRAAGERIEDLLDTLRTSTDPRAVAAAEDLVRTLVDLYGQGLAQVMRIAGEQIGRAHV